MKGAGIITIGLAALSMACGEIRDVYDSPVHKLSFGQGTYLTISETATNFMVDVWFKCKAQNNTDCACGTWTLGATRNAVDAMLKNDTVRSAWKQTYGRGFANGYGCDMTTAIYDMGRRNHECLRVHYFDNINWTTGDASLAECKE
ncbi:MAG TPA: hypothetical protein VI072_03760 [Polyangiaceae bacterium]